MVTKVSISKASYVEQIDINRRFNSPPIYQNELYDSFMMWPCRLYRDRLFQQGSTGIPRGRFAGWHAGCGVSSHRMAPTTGEPLILSCMHRFVDFRKDMIRSIAIFNDSCHTTVLRMSDTGRAERVSLLNKCGMLKTISALYGVEAAAPTVDRS